MKALLIITALTISTQSVKAEDDITPKEMRAYNYGYVTGTGGTLCDAVENNQMTKEFAKGYFDGLVESLINDQRAIDSVGAIKAAKDGVIKGCKKVFE